MRRCRARARLPMIADFTSIKSTSCKSSKMLSWRRRKSWRWSVARRGARSTQIKIDERCHTSVCTWPSTICIACSGLAHAGLPAHLAASGHVHGSWAQSSHGARAAGSACRTCACPVRPEIDRAAMPRSSAGVYLHDEHMVSESELVAVSETQMTERAAHVLAMQV